LKKSNLWVGAVRDWYIVQMGITWSNAPAGQLLQRNNVKASSMTSNSSCA